MSKKCDITLERNFEYGKLFDFFMAINHGFNYDKHFNVNILEKRRIVPDPLVDELFSKVWETADINALGLSLFFTIFQEGYSYFMIQYLKDFRRIGNIQSLIDKFFNDDQKLDLLKYYDDSSYEDIYYEEIISNKNKLIKKINSFNINEKIKWELILYFSSTKLINESLREFFYDIAEKIEWIHHKHKNLVESSLRKMEKKQEESKDEFFLCKENPINKSSLGDYKTFNISISLLHEVVVIHSLNYYVIGFNYGKNLASNIANNVLICEAFRYVSDINRLKILVELKDREVSVGEIANFLGLASSTTSYHLNILYGKKLLVKRKIGKSIYYSTNKNKVLNLISEIENFLIP